MLGLVAETTNVLEIVACSASGNMSSFVEAALAINMLSGLYKGFREIATKFETNKVKETIAVIETLEADDSQSCLLEFNSDIEPLEKFYYKWISIICSWSQKVSLLFVILCAITLYFDYSDNLGRNTIWLVLPFPLCFLFSILVYRIFKHKLKKVSIEYKAYAKVKNKINAKTQNLKNQISRSQEILNKLLDSIDK